MSPGDGAGGKALKTLDGMLQLSAAGASEPEMQVFLDRSGVPMQHLRIAQQERDRGRQEAPNFGESMGRGFVDIIEGARQVTGTMSPEREQRAREELDLYEAGAGPGFDPGRTTGQIAATAPLGVAGGTAAKGLVARSALGATVGAGTGALIFAPEDEERVRNILLGAGAGALGSAVVEPVVRGGARLARNAISGLRSAPGRITGAASGQADALLERAAGNVDATLGGIDDAARARARADVVRAARPGSDLPPEAIARRADIEAAGFVDDAAPTRGQVTREADQYSNERNLAKRQHVGPELSSRFNVQEARARDLLDAFGERVGGPGFATRGPQQAGEIVESAAQRQWGQIQGRTDEAYNAVRAATNDAPVDTSKLVAQVGDSRELASAVRKLPGSVRGDVRRLLNGKPQTFDELVELDQALGRATQGQTDGNARWAAGKVQAEVRSLMDTVGESIGDEPGRLYREAVDVAREGFEERGPVNQLTGRLTGEGGRVDTVLGQVMGGDPRQIERLMAFVAPQGPEATDAIRGMVVKRLLERSTPSGNFSQAAFVSQLKNMGRERLGLVFGADGSEQLLRFGRAVEALMATPYGHTVNTSNTASAAESIVRQGLGLGADAQSGGIVGLLRGIVQQARTGAAQRTEQRSAKAALDTIPRRRPVEIGPRTSAALRGLPASGAGPAAAAVPYEPRRR
ncbi:MAG: hypothetical protein ACR2RL_21825 [Gammaproteobacteria bacterium]